MKNLTKNQKVEMFDRLWFEYVSAHGLGGMSKTDLDALILWSYAELVENHDNFFLGRVFKIKESRVRSLLATGEVKFDKALDADAWRKLLKDLSESKYQIESLEKGQVRFALRKQHYFRHIQRQARTLGDTFEQKQNSEQIIANLSTFYRILDTAWNELSFGEAWTKDCLSEARENIKTIIGRIGEGISDNELETLKKAKSSKLFKAFEQGSKFLSIGKFVIRTYESISSQG